MLFLQTQVIKHRINIKLIFQVTVVTKNREFVIHQNFLQ